MKLQLLCYIAIISAASVKDAKAKLLREKVVTILIEGNNKDNDENPQSSNCEGDNGKLRTINLEESGLQTSKTNSQLKTWRPPWRICETKCLKLRYGAEGVEKFPKIKMKYILNKDSSVMLSKDQNSFFQMVQM